MTVTTYAGWVADGEPWHACQPVADFSATLKKHGYTVYVIGNSTHLHANPPEDHTPYSHTPWPGPQPYPAVLAMDIMPGGSLDWHELGRRLVADKNAGVPGTEAIKYINWTNSAGQCLHEKWEPNHQTSSSADTGHIHISFRTDYATSHVMANYDPIAITPVGNPTKPTTPQEDWELAHWTNVKSGVKGQSAKNAQGLLKAHGLDIGATGPQKNGIDGDFGPKCVAATKQLQHMYGIPEDGEFGPQTFSVACFGHDYS